MAQKSSSASDKPTTTHSASSGSSPLPASARFAAIADYFLAEQKAIYKSNRTTLYKKEREVIELWAQDTDVPLEWIRKGIWEGFKEALERKRFVSSLLWCAPHVALAIRYWEKSIEGSQLWYERRKAGR